VLPVPDASFGASKESTGSAACAGFGYWLAMPTWLVRLIWSVLLLAYGAGGILYVLLWIFMPIWDRVPEDYEERAGG
jgi:phage shock protein PspC (stress-responsive transcriptional regulator)